MPCSDSNKFNYQNSIPAYPIILKGGHFRINKHSSFPRARHLYPTGVKIKLNNNHVDSLANSKFCVSAFCFLTPERRASTSFLSKHIAYTCSLLHRKPRVGSINLMFQSPQEYDDVSLFLFEYSSVAYVQIQPLMYLIKNKQDRSEVSAQVHNKVSFEFC